MILEVCVDSLESALNAVYNGADELEVCSSLHDGGLTPSAGLVQQIINMINRYVALKLEQRVFIQRPKVNVMLRCRPGWDFCFTDLEIDTMLGDIDIFKGMGVDRFVFGALTAAQQVDDIQCIKVLAQVYPIPLTFHRAFDMCKDPRLAIDEIIQLGFSRVLTSGHKASAADPEAVELIMSLVHLRGDKIEIMPGAGVNMDNVKTFIDMGCTIVHSSCKCLRPMPVLGAHLGLGDWDRGVICVTDGSIVEKMKKFMSSCDN